MATNLGASKPETHMKEAGRVRGGGRISPPPLTLITSPPSYQHQRSLLHLISPIKVHLLCSQIFLELDGEKKEGVEFLDTTLTIGKADQVLNDVNSLELSHHVHDQVLEAGGGQGGGSGAPSFVCPTLPCQLFASTVLR